MNKLRELTYTLQNYDITSLIYLLTLHGRVGGIAKTDHVSHYVRNIGLLHWLPVFQCIKFWILV